MKYRLFGVGLKGKAPMVTAQHRINCYVEEIIDEDGAKTALVASPGLDLFSSDSLVTPWRGWIVVDDVLYGVKDNAFYSVDHVGTTTSQGTLNTNVGRIDIFSDDGDVIQITDGTNGYTYTISTDTFAVISDGDYPDTAPTGAWDQFFVAFGPSDTFQISDDGTTWDALDIASANVGTIVRGTADHGELVIFGVRKATFWTKTGGADFPYQIVVGADIEIGLAARWSLCKFDDSLAFLGRSSGGQVQVYRLNGHTPVPISTPELDSIINRYSRTDDATAHSYTFEGHRFYRINFPTEGKSWEYDALASVRTGAPVWSERQSGTTGERHRGELAIDYAGAVRIADYSNDNIYTVSGTTYAENEEQYPFEVTSRRIDGGGEPIEVNSVRLDFEPGVGLASGQGSDPQVMLQCSRDGGHTWGSTLYKSIGTTGQYMKTTEFGPFGTADHFVFKARVTDPVKRVLVNASAIE